MKLATIAYLTLLTLATAKKKHKGNKPAEIQVVADPDILFTDQLIQTWALSECINIGGWTLIDVNLTGAVDSRTRLDSTCQCAHGNTYENKNLSVVDRSGHHIGTGILTFGYHDKKGCQRTGINEIDDVEP